MCLPSAFALKESSSITVLSVAYPLFPVGSWSSGGAEQILYLLERGLVEMGARSLVVAARGSRVSGTLFETSSCEGLQTEDERARATSEHLTTIQKALATEHVDLIHYHGLDFYRYMPEQTRAVRLATLHLPPDWYGAKAFGPSISLVCVSNTQAANFPYSHPCSIIQNGIAVENFQFSSTKSDELLWLGRVCPEKGTDHALRVARALDVPLTVAGPVHRFEAHERYFEQEVRPLLDGRRRYIGPVAAKDKAELLSHARCLLLPSLAPETSSLVAMEAAASGTPVVAYRSGALPEIVEDGLTGFIVDSEAEMAEAVLRCSEISRSHCRRSAESRFEARRMVKDYRELYHRLISTWSHVE